MLAGQGEDAVDLGMGTGVTEDAPIILGIAPGPDGLGLAEALANLGDAGLGDATLAPQLGDVDAGLLVDGEQGEQLGDGAGVVVAPEVLLDLGEEGEERWPRW